MSIERDKMIKLLESKIETIVRNVIREKSELIHSTDDEKNRAIHSKRGEDNVEKNQSYKRQYKAIEKELGQPEVDATGVFVKAGVIPSNKDDAARSHAFKKLHKDKTPDGTGNYKFEPDELAKIFNAMP